MAKATDVGDIAPTPSLTISPPTVTGGQATFTVTYSITAASAPLQPPVYYQFLDPAASNAETVIYSSPPIGQMIVDAASQAKALTEPVTLANSLNTYTFNYSITVQTKKIYLFFATYFLNPGYIHYSVTLDT